MLMGMGHRGPGSQVQGRSRALAATGTGCDCAEQWGAILASGMERKMRP
jgi:hypothetical protein